MECVSQEQINAVTESKVSEQEDVLKNIDVSDEFRVEIERLVKQNKDIFALSDTDLGRTSTVEMKLDTGDHAPIKQRPYRNTTKTR